MDTTIDIDTSEDLGSTFCHESSIAVFLDEAQSDVLPEDMEKIASEWEEKLSGGGHLFSSGASSPTVALSPRNSECSQNLSQTEMLR